MQGQWLYCRSSRSPRRAVAALASSGSSGISARGWANGTSNMTALRPLGDGLGTGGRQMGQGPLGGLGRQRLVVLDRLEVRLTEVLPDADVEGPAALVEDQDQDQGDSGLAGGDGEHEEHEDLAL